MSRSQLDKQVAEGRADVPANGRQGRRRLGSGRPRIPLGRLDAMIEEAIVDAYNESEQAVGFHATLEQHLRLPFETVVFSVAVTVKKVDITRGGDIVAVCFRRRERLAIPLLELPLPNPAPTGWEWIEAYRRWARGRR